MSINPKSVEFYQCHAKPHSICFSSQYIKDNEGNLCQDLLTIENTDSDLKKHALLYANELLVRVRLTLQKILQNRSTYRNITKKMFGKRVMTRIVLVVDKSTDHDKPYFDLYIFMSLRQYQRQRKCSLSEREMKKALRDNCATHWRERRSWDLLIFTSKGENILPLSGCLSCHVAA